MMSLLRGKIPSHIVVAASAWISRIVAAFVQLLSVRILIDGLGVEQYAIFSVLIGLMGWFMLSDIGIGTSLQNFISERQAEQKNYGDFISAAAICAIGILILTIPLLYILSVMIGPILLQTFNIITEHEKITLFFIVGVLGIITCIGNIVYKIWYAKHKGYLSNILPALASIMSLILVWVASKSNVNTKLLLSIVAYLLPAGLISVISFAYEYMRAKSGFDVHITKKIFSRAYRFWFFSVMASVVLQIDYIIISQYLRPDDIVIYNITTKIYSFIAFIYGAVLLALWPKFTEMIYQSNWVGVIGYLRRNILLGIIFIILSTLILSNFIQVLVKLLAPGQEIFISTSLVVLMGLYHIIRVWTDSFSMVLQSMSLMRPFWILVPVQALFSVVFQIIFVSIYGLNGIVVGLILSYVLTVVWALPQVVFKLAKKREGITE